MNLPDGHSHALGGYAVRWEAEPLRFTVESLAASGRSAVGRVCGAGNLVPPGEQHGDTAAPLHREPQPTL